MKPFYLKGNYDGNPTFVMITSFPSKVTVEMIIYNSTSKKWFTEETKFDLNNSKQKREYHNFLEKFFASNSREYQSAKKCLTKPLPLNALPKKPVEPIIPIEELIEKIKQFKNTKRKKDKE